MSKKTISLDLDRKFTQLVNRRIEALKRENSEDLRRAGQEELADNVEQADVDEGDYLKQLVVKDLREAGLIEEDTA